jgi:AcrR family transcriptional regulator
MVRKTKEEAQETYDRILASAVNVFYEKGVRASTLDDIARDAGVTRGAIYWHFKNKLDLFTALHNRTHHDFTDRVIAIQNTPTDSHLEQLADFCVDTLLEIQNNAERRKILSVFMTKCDYACDMASFLEDQDNKKEECHTIMGGFFERAMAQGELPADTEPRLMALALYFYMCGIMMEQLRTPALFKSQACLQKLIHVFFKNLRPAKV